MMDSSPMQTGVQCLRRLAAAAGRPDESDEQLLHAFTTCRDDSAFTALVRRHGPMVFHVCRRVLEHQQDAEDAFQATFLVLARNPASLRSKSSLSSFLHGTAYRTAMKAKRSAARRGKREGSLGALTQPRSPINPAEDLSWREVRTFLDEEIARLPEKYRTAFVLCCLKNLSQAEAARRLSLKERTLSSQLAAARKRLQQALTRRGVELTAVLAAIALVTPPASALPAGLAAKTIKAVVAMASGKELAAVVSASVAELVEGATTALMASKIKIAAVLLLVATSGSLVGMYRRASEPLAGTVDDKNTTLPQQTAAKTLEIKGRVFGADGQPKAGAKLLLLRADGDLKQLGTTAADGGFTVAVPKAATNHYLIAQADGLGLDFLPLPAGKSKMPIVLRLVKDRAIRGRIVNTEGKPVAGVRLAVKTIGVYADNSLDTFLSAWKMRPLWARLPDGDKRLGSGMERLFATTTDAEGHFSFHGIGDERLVTLRLSGGGMADDELCIVNRDKFDPQPLNRAMRDNARNTPKAMQHRVNRQPLYGPEFTVIAQAEKILRGTVKDTATGKERPGVLVHLTARDEDVLLQLPYSTRTDAHGRYELRGVRKATRYKLVVASDTNTGHMACDKWVADTPGYQPVRADIAVKKGVVITGRVIDRATGKAISGSAMTDVLVNNPFIKDYPPFYYTSWEKTDTQGRFRVVTIPGPVLLMGMADYQQTEDGINVAMKYKKAIADAKYPQYFDKAGSETLYFRSVNLRGLVQGNYCKVLDIKPGSAIVEQDIVLERAKALTVAIRDAEGRPVRGVWAAGISPANGMGAIQIQGDSCSVYGVEKGKPRLMVFYDANKKHAGMVTLKGDEQQPVSVKLGPIGAIKGRLLDGDGKPIAGVVVEVHYRDREVEAMHLAIHKEQVRSDAAGAFAFDELIPEKPFSIVFLHRGQPLTEEGAKARPPVFLEVKPGECRDLGAIHPQGQSMLVRPAGEQIARAPGSAKHMDAKNVEIQGRVVGPDGKPKAAAKLLLLGEESGIKQVGTAAADGRFLIAVPKSANNSWLIAQTPDTGIDFFRLGQLRSGKSIELHLAKDQTIRGRVVNTEGKPIHGVRVAVQDLFIYANHSLDSFLIAWKNRRFQSEIPELTDLSKHLWSRKNLLCTTSTDKEGRFALRGVGVERFASLRLSGAGIADAVVYVANRQGFDPKPYNQSTLNNLQKDVEQRGTMLHGPDVAVVAEAEKPIRGRVTDAGSGKGCPNLDVWLMGRDGNQPAGVPIETTTDAKGRYEIHGVHKAKSYTLHVQDDVTGYVRSQITAGDTAGFAPIPMNIRVKKGVIITGKVLDASTGKPIAGGVQAVILQDNSFVKEYPERGFNLRTEDTAEDGTFRVVAIPGPILLMGGPNTRWGGWVNRMKYKPPVPDPKYPRYFQKFSDVWCFKSL